MAEPDRASRIATARAAREARLAKSSTPGKVHGYINGAARAGMSTASRWWDKFCAHLRAEEAYDELDTVDTIRGPVLHLTHGLITEFMRFWTKNATPLLGAVPSMGGAINTAKHLYNYMEKLVGVELAEDIRSSGTAACRDLLKAGKLARYNLDPSLITPASFEAMARSAFDLRWTGKRMFTRFEFLFIHSLQLSSATRAATHLPSDAEPISSSHYITYGHVVINVRRGTQRYNQIALTYTPVRHKTGSTKKMDHTLLPRDVLWRCPVLWWLVLATRDGVLPYTVAELYDPKILGGEQSRYFTVKTSHKSIPILKAANRGGNRNHWTTQTFRKFIDLSRRLADIPTVVKLHDYRRTMAVMLYADGHTLHDIAYMLGHAITGVTRKYLQAFTTFSGGAAVYGTADDTQAILDNHPSAVKPLAKPRIPVLPSISALRPATNEPEVISAKEEVIRLSAQYTELYGSVRNIPPEAKTILDIAWRRYSCRLCKWVRYYDDVHLYEAALRESGADVPQESEDTVAQLEDTPIDSEVFDEHEVQSDEQIDRDVGDEGIIRNLYDITKDGSAYGYQADHIEQVLSTTALDTCRDVALFTEEQGVSDDLVTADNDASIPIDPALLDMSTSDVHEPSEDIVGVITSGRRHSTSDSEEDTGEDDKGGEPSTHDGYINKQESVFIAALDAMRVAVFPPAPVEGDDAIAARIAIVEYSACLPELTCEWYGYRPGHLPIGDICPVHHLPLSQCMGKRVTATKPRPLRLAKRRHIHREMPAYQAKAFGPTLLARQYPTHQNLFVSVKRSGQEDNPEGITNQFFNARTIFNAAGTRYLPRCALCPDEFVLRGLGMAYSHFLLEHDVMFIQGAVYYSKREERDAHMARGWTIEDLIVKYPVWDPEHLRYLVDPVEVEQGYKAQYEQVIVSPAAAVAQYGLRDDIYIPDDVLPTHPRDVPADHKYRFETPTEEAPRCFVCVHNRTECWETRMRTYDLAKGLRVHVAAHLARELGKIHDWYDNKPAPTWRNKQKPGVNKVQQRLVDTHAQRKPVYIDDNDHIVCPDPVCSKQPVRLASLLELVQHLILVHRIAPFVTVQAKLDFLQPLDWISPVDDDDMQLILGENNYEFIPKGIRLLDSFGNPSGKERKLLKNGATPNRKTKARTGRGSAAMHKAKAKRAGKRKAAAMEEEEEEEEDEEEDEEEEGEGEGEEEEP